jgi:hypothetical protein
MINSRKIDKMLQSITEITECLDNAHHNLRLLQDKTYIKTYDGNYHENIDRIEDAIFMDLYNSLDILKKELEKHEGKLKNE